MLSIVSAAWRSWKNAKAVALLAILALAAGIGSTTAIYTVVHAVLLKPLPYQKGERFAALYGASLSEPGVSSMNYPDVLTYQQRTHSFDVFGWFRFNQFNLTSPGQPEHINGVEVTPTLACGLGVNPMIGRWFCDPLHEPGGYAAAVLSNALWRRLGGDPNMMGRPITLDGRVLTVLGVMPPWFRLPVGGPGAFNTRTDVWLPLDPRVEGRDRLSGIYFPYVRLKPSATFVQAEADVKEVAQYIARRDPAGHPAYTAKLQNLRGAVSSEIRPVLLMLFGAAGLLLLITCANVAGLLVTRSVARAREIAVRVALGAARSQLVLQFGSEGLLLALAGAVCGVAVSLALLRAVLAVAAEYVPRADEITVDWTALLFALVAALVAIMLSSLAPLWQALRTQPNEILADAARASQGMRSRRLSQWLVIAEVAVTFILLAASARLITQLENLAHVRPGFDPKHLVTFQLDVPEAQYGTAALLRAYQRRLISAFEAIPGVQHVAFVNQVPMAGCCFTTTMYPEGRAINAKAVQSISYLVVSPDYLRTMQIPLLEGRFLNDRDNREDLLAAIINQTAARYYWPNRDALGAYGHYGGPSGDRLQVVGIIADVRNDGLGKPPRPEIYMSSTVYALQRMHFMIRSVLAESTLARELRRAAFGVNPEQPVHDIRPMEEVIEGSLSIARLSSLLTTFFAIAALLMAGLGVYGVVAYSVRQRTVEIGTRLALGAVPGDLLRLVIGDGLKMGTYGIVIGGIIAAVLGPFLTRSFDIQSVNPVSFLSSLVIVAAATALASFFPGWWATRLSPMVAIRNEPGSMWETGLRRIAGELMRRDKKTDQFSDATLVSELIDALRASDSFLEALHTALASVRQEVGCEWVFLLENRADQYRCIASTPESDQSRCSLPAKGFLLKRLQFYARPLPLTKGDFDAWLRWAGDQRPQYVDEIQALMRTGARLAVPVRAKKENIGLLLLGAPADRIEYSMAQKQALRVCAEQLALMMENARLTERIVEQEKLRRDLALAAEVQKRLLPEKPPETAIASLAAHSLAARTVGGDYYDFLEVGNHRIGIALADVAGKGVAAALIMSAVHASLRAISAEGHVSLPELAARMNHFLYRSTRSNSYATFFYAQVDEESRQLRYVNAGHNPPYLLRSANGIEELSTGGMIIGMFPQASYEEAKLDLQSGDVLIIFTDGVTEAMNPKEEEFGEERLKALLRRVSCLPVNEMAAQISEELTSWIGSAPQHDDLTFIVMKVN